MTKPGQRATLKLRDGSTVRINAASRLVIPDDYGREVRRLTLEGEAYFEVEENAAVPFIVETAWFTTTALGTAFCVNAFPQAARAHVALATGKIAVSRKTTEDPGEEIILNPNEGLFFVNDDPEVTKTHFDPLVVFGWKDDVLSFKGASLDEIITRLERWYGISIVVQNLKNNKAIF